MLFVLYFQLQRKASGRNVGLFWIYKVCLALEPEAANAIL